MPLAQCFVHVPCTKQINSNFNFYKDHVPRVAKYDNSVSSGNGNS